MKEKEAILPNSIKNAPKKVVEEFTHEIFIFLFRRVSFIIIHSLAIFWHVHFVIVDITLSAV